jgi:hypothetical protein
VEIGKGRAKVRGVSNKLDFWVWAGLISMALDINIHPSSVGDFQARCPITPSVCGSDQKGNHNYPKDVSAKLGSWRSDER